MFDTVSEYRCWPHTPEAKHLSVIFANMLDGTWASVEGLEKVVSYGCGTTAGVPMADLLFMAALDVILRSILNTFKALDIQTVA